MRMTRRSALTAAAILAAPLTIGQTTPAQAQADDATLVVGTMWESLPLSMTARRSRFFNESEILDTLVKMDFDMQLQPGLALEWSRPTPTQWVFRLREGVEFHDGTPFDAAAAQYSLERVIDLLPYAADLLNIDTITTAGPYELVIETNEPFAALPNQLTDAITGIYGAASFDANGEFVEPIGTGPWHFVEYNRQQNTIVERFDAYWGETPELARVEYRYIPDHHARTIALEAGEIDIATNILPGDVERLGGTPDFTVFREPSAGLYYAAFNTADDRPVGDVRVRMALNLMVDRELVVSGALDGVGEPAWQFFRDSHAWVPADVPRYELDLTRAAALLEDAGYERVDGRWERDGAPLTLDILSYTTRTEMPLITEAVAALLSAQGVTVNIDLFTWPGMLDLVRQGEYDLSVVFWTPDMIGHPDLHLKSQFHSGAELNYQNWSHDGFDAAVDRGRTLDPGTDRDAAYREALTILHEEAIVMPLVYKIYVAAARNDVQGFRVHPSGFFYNFKQITLEG